MHVVACHISFVRIICRSRPGQGELCITCFDGQAGRLAGSQLLTRYRHRVGFYSGAVLRGHLDLDGVVPDVECDRVAGRSAGDGAQRVSLANFNRRLRLVDRRRQFDVLHRVRHLHRVGLGSRREGAEIQRCGEVITIRAGVGCKRPKRRIRGLGNILYDDGSGRSLGIARVAIAQVGCTCCPRQTQPNNFIQFVFCGVMHD